MRKSLLATILILRKAMGLAYGDQSLGTFSDVKFIAQEGDCVGMEVTLWATNDGARGQLRDYEGSCETPSWTLNEVKYDSKTRHISFSANNQFVHVFDGTVTARALSGYYGVGASKSEAKRRQHQIVLKRKSSGK